MFPLSAGLASRSETVFLTLRLPPGSARRPEGRRPPSLSLDSKVSDPEARYDMKVLARPKDACDLARQGRRGNRKGFDERRLNIVTFLLYKQGTLAEHLWYCTVAVVAPLSANVLQERMLEMKDERSGWGVL